jgi:hypothetical protein
LKNFPSHLNISRLSPQVAQTIFTPLEIYFKSKFFYRLCARVQCLEKGLKKQNKTRSQMNVYHFLYSTQNKIRNEKKRNEISTKQFWHGRPASTHKQILSSLLSTLLSLSAHFHLYI